MAIIISTLSVDQQTQSSSLTMTYEGSLIESITFDNNEITIDTRPFINIPGVDFMDMVQIINTYQKLMLQGFNLNQFQIVPFNAMTSMESHDSSTNEWSLITVVGAVPRFFNYTALGMLKTVNLNDRANPKTITFPEWVKSLEHLNSYANSVKGFLNIG